MAFTSSHFGEIDIIEVLKLDKLAGVGTRSSIWQILEAFCADGRIASRVAIGPTGALLLATEPGVPNSGAFYFYDNSAMEFYALHFELQDTFNPAWFDIVVTTYDLHLLIDRPPVIEKKPVQYQGQNRNNGRRRRNRGGRGRNSQHEQVRIGEVAVAA